MIREKNTQISMLKKSIKDIEIGLYEKAKERLFELLKGDPYNIYALNNLGVIYLNIGNVKIADRIFKKAVNFEKEKFIDLRRNLQTVERLKRPPKLEFTFLIYIDNEKDLINIWKKWLRNTLFPEKSEYILLLINPSPFIQTFLSKRRIFYISSNNLVDAINKGFINSNGKLILFSPFYFIKKGIYKNLIDSISDLSLLIDFNNLYKDIFLVNSSLFYDVGILKRNLPFKNAIKEYIERVKLKRRDVSLIKIDDSPGFNIEEDSSKISLCMIVRNEEKNIGRCLRSVEGLVDEIIVVDTGSTDKTPQIAKTLGAKVYFYPWKNDFSLARNESIKYAKYPWIFWLDADDYIEGKDKENFLSFKNMLSKTEYMAFRMPTYSIRRGIFNKKDVNYLTRIFRNLPDIKFEGKIHEQVLFSISRLGGKVGTVDIPIYHTGYEDPKILEEKRQRNKEILESALKEEPKNPIFLTYLGRVYLEEWIGGRGDVKKAKDMLLKAIKFFPESETNYLSYVYLNLSLIYYHLKNFDTAIEYAKKAIHINKNIETAYEVWGRSLMYLGRLDEAERIFLRLEDKIDRESPSYIKISNFDYRYFLALIQFNLGKYREAIENFKKIDIIKKEEENIDFHIGLSYYKLKEFNLAITYFQRALEKDPAHYDSWNNLGKIYIETGNYEKAKECCKRALDIREGEEAIFNLGYVYYQEKEYVKAKEYFKKLLNLSTKRSLLNNAYFYLASIEFIENDIYGAKRYLDFMENNDSKRIIGYKYYLLKGKILEKMEDIAGSAKVFAEGLTIYDRNIELMEALSENLEKQGKILDAISIRREIAKYRKSKKNLYKLGLLYGKINLFSEAVGYFEELLRDDPKNINLYNDIGVFYGLMGDFNKAKDFLKKALDLDPSNKLIKSNLQKLVSKENKRYLNSLKD